MEIKGKQPTPDVIEVQGILGSFDLPNQKVNVRFLSTFASKRDLASGSAKLLSELKPMRERVKASELNDLGALLQRDLNDSRVAKDLVPYLTGIGNQREVAFFPAVLAVLMPAGFMQGKDVEYPSPLQQDNVEYGDNWEVSRYELNGTESNFGMLSVFPSRTDVLVLDGQHRASAFRYITGDLEGSAEEIYSAFYQGVETPDRILADLPVTVIWFESDSPIDPNMISRNLFVDVNNTAREVSRSRSILLDDREVPSLMTRFTFSELARKSSYGTSHLSLLHTAIDIDSALIKGVGHQISLTNPEYVYDMLSWLTLGTQTYDSKDRYSVSRSDGRQKKFTEIFGSLFDGSITDRDLIVTGEDDDPKVILDDTDKVSDFEAEFGTRLGGVVAGLFNGLSFLSPHFEAAAHIKDWCESSGTATRTEVWRRVFTSGEGLYYTFKHGKADGPKIDSYNAEIDEIEAEFLEKRAKIFDAEKSDVDRLYDSVRTKAFQVGLIMALREYKRHTEIGTYMESMESIVMQLNVLSNSQWLVAMTELKKRLIGSADPKSWPSYQKLFLRIATKDDSDSFYTEDDFDNAPEGQILNNMLVGRVKAWAKTEAILRENLEESHMEEMEIEAWVKADVETIKNIFVDSGLVMLDVDYESKGFKYIQSYIS